MPSHTASLKFSTVAPQSKRCIAWALSAGILFSCAKAPTILRNGVEMPVEQAAKLDYEDGEIFLAKKKYKEAGARFRNIIERMPRSSYADRAMWRQAQVYRTQNNLNGAAKILEALLTKYPQSPITIPAKEDLGGIFHAQKNYKRSAEILSSIPWKDVTPQRRVSIEKIIRSSFDLSPTPLFREKLYWLLSVLDATPSVDNPKLRGEILEALSKLEDRKDVEELFRQRDNRFPASFAALKIAKMAFRSGNPEGAKEWVNLFLSRYPIHEQKSEALQLSAQLMRAEDVDPTAVGVLLPLSGNNKTLAEQVLRGISLAARIFDPKSPESASQAAVNFFIEDTGNTSEKAAAATQKLVAEHKIIAAIGPLFLKDSQNAAQAALEVNLPMISMSPAEGIPEIGATIFRNSLTKSEQASSLAHLAIDILGIRRAAIIYPQNNYGTEFMSLFWTEFEKRGGEIRGAESYEAQSGDLSVPIKRLVGLAPIELRAGEICSNEEAAKRVKLSETKTDVKICYPRDKLPPIVDFEAVFIPDGFEKVTQIVPTLIYYDVRGVQVLGTNLLNTMDIFRGRTAESMQGTIFLDGFFKNRKEPPVPQFVQRAYSTFGVEPGVIEAQAYDTASVVLDILNKTRPASRGAFAEALKAVKDFPAVSGEMTFGPSRDARRRLTPLMIEGDQIVELQ